MNFVSIYPQMIDAASSIPDEANVKLLMRHSIRFDNPPDGDYSNLLLTPEGIELARKVGTGIDREIGVLVSSPVKRCRQTIESVVSGIAPQYKKNILCSDGYECKDGTHIKLKICDELTKIKGNIRPKEEGGIGWYEYFYYLQNNDLEGTRGVSLETECKPILDCIFSNNGGGNKLDIFCSHDSHLVMLGSALFDLKTGFHEASDKWVSFTEGMFLYGTRENFTAMFRGVTKSFKNLWC